jgi:hypothetical protein
LTPPTHDPSAIFADDDAKPHAGSAVAGIAQPPQLQHAIAQWVDHYYGRRRRDRDRGGNWHHTPLWRDHNPGPIGTLLIASTLIVTVATRSQLTLRCNDSTAGTPDDRADCSAAPAA